MVSTWHKSCNHKYQDAQQDASLKATSERIGFFNRFIQFFRHKLVERSSRHDKENFPLYSHPYIGRRHDGLWIEVEGGHYRRSDEKNHDDCPTAGYPTAADHHNDYHSIVSRAGSEFSSLQGMAM